MEVQGPYKAPLVACRHKRILNKSYLRTFRPGTYTLDTELRKSINATKPKDSDHEEAEVKAFLIRLYFQAFTELREKIFTEYALFKDSDFLNTHIREKISIFPRHIYILESSSLGHL